LFGGVVVLLLFVLVSWGRNNFTKYDYSPFTLLEAIVVAPEKALALPGNVLYGSGQVVRLGQVG